jgi:hypothetical protein
MGLPGASAQRRRHRATRWNDGITEEKRAVASTSTGSRDYDLEEAATKLSVAHQLRDTIDSLTGIRASTSSTSSDRASGIRAGRVGKRRRSGARALAGRDSRPVGRRRAIRRAFSGACMNVGAASEAECMERRP